MLVLGLGKRVEQVEEVVATLGQLLVGVLLQVRELGRVGVHPVPDGSLQALNKCDMIKNSSTRE
jgi:hypothetical protein